MEETTVWRGHSSQILNLGRFLLYGLIVAILLAALVSIAWAAPATSTIATGGILVLTLVPLGFALVDWLKLRSRVYELTSERFLVTHGIFSKQTDAMELYRVTDLNVLQPFLLRLF